LLVSRGAMATVPASDPAAPMGANPAKQPRTERGRQTMRKLLDAAAIEFGERGFHEASISGITRRAGTALGSFYTYFDSKDAIFTALVRDMSSAVARHAAAAITPEADTLGRERQALAAFLGFARQHKEIYRIIDEAEFADPASYRNHYETTAKRIAARLDAGVLAGDLIPGDNDVRAWAIMGMNVFLGLRFGVWDDARNADEIAGLANDLVKRGIESG
jgi:AcrR family transcriptional regulator